jgi:hypothetical protein
MNRRRAAGFSFPRVWSCNAIHLIYEAKSRPRIVSSPFSQHFGDDHTRSFDTQMKFLPGALTATTMLDSGPLTFADDG